MTSQAFEFSIYHALLTLRSLLQILGWGVMLSQTIGLEANLGVGLHFPHASALLDIHRALYHPVFYAILQRNGEFGFDQIRMLSNSYYP